MHTDILMDGDEITGRAAVHTIDWFTKRLLMVK